MKILQRILITLTILTGCAKRVSTSTQTKTNTPAAFKHMTTNTDRLNYLALGDSYTIGEAVPESQSFPYQLYSTLNDQGLNVQPPAIIATTGWTTDELIDAISESGITDKKFDIVTLLVGVNDQYRHLSKDDYKVKFAQVLNTAINFAHGDASRVFVLSIPDWGVTPFAGGQGSVIGPEIDQFNALNKVESLRAGVHYVDITPISREAATAPLLIASDGLHPSGLMYSQWVKLLAPLVEARLKKKNI